jgi:hypothetical protein
MDAGQMTLAKLNSFLGGKGPEWGVEAAPSGAALPIQVRGYARELGNAGKTAEAADYLLKNAVLAKVGIPATMLSEIESTILPQATSQSLRASIGGNLALLRNSGGRLGGGAGAASTGTSSVQNLFHRLFGRG